MSRDGSGQRVLTVRPGTPGGAATEVRLLRLGEHLILAHGPDPFAVDADAPEHGHLTELATACALHRPCPRHTHLPTRWRRWEVRMPGARPQLVDHIWRAESTLVDYLARREQAGAVVQIRQGSTVQLWPRLTDWDSTPPEFVQDRDKLAEVAAARGWRLTPDPVGPGGGGALLAWREVVIRLEFTAAGAVSSVHVEGDQVYSGGHRFGFALAALRSYGS